jgi:hypothetical protein
MARHQPARSSIRSGKVPYCKFNLTVGKLPPILNGWRKAILRVLIDNLACFAASRVNGQPKYISALRVRKSYR